MEHVENPQQGLNRFGQLWHTHRKACVALGILFLIVVCVVVVRLVAPKLAFHYATGLALDYDSLNIDVVPELGLSIANMRVREPDGDVLVVSADALQFKLRQSETTWVLDALDADTVFVDTAAATSAVNNLDLESVDEKPASSTEPFALPELGPIVVRDLTLSLSTEGDEGPQTSTFSAELRPAGSGYRLSVDGVHADVPLSLDLTLAEADDVLSSDDIAVGIAGNTLRGIVTVDMGAQPRRVDFSLDADRFEWALPSERDDTWSPDARVGSDQRLVLDWLRDWEIDGKVAVDAVVYEDLVVDNTSLDITLDGGVLSLGPLRSEVFGGEVVALGQLDYSSGSRARWNLGLHAEDMYWSTWPTVASFGLDSQAPSEIVIDLEGFGRSTAEMLATTEGSIQALVGESEIDGQYLDAIGGDLVMLGYRFMRAGQDEASDISQIQCGSVNLKFEEGRLKADRQVLVQSPHVNLFFNGFVDLHNERIEFNMVPRARGGVGVNLNKYFQSIKLSGNLTGLRPNVNATGSVALAAELWAGALTGGASSLVLGVIKSIRHRGKTCEGILPRIVEPGEWFSAHP